MVNEMPKEEKKSSKIETERVNLLNLTQCGIVSVGDGKLDAKNQIRKSSKVEVLLFLYSSVWLVPVFSVS